jgi:N-acetylglucosaminyl-diphospho-decaprenol L-rhamnosyltransferase
MKETHLRTSATSADKSAARLDFSIVIPTFDTAAMTLACCRAAIAAAPPESEVIVVDDGSSDGTCELLRTEVPEVRIVRLEVNRRFSAAANAGVAVAKGTIILLLNSDTRIDRDAPAKILEAFAGDAKLGVAGAQLVDAGGTPQWSGGPQPTLLWMAVMVSGIARVLPKRKRKRGGDVGWVSGAAMAFRREVWTDAGPFNETYRFYAQDLELCVRARAHGWRVRVIEDARVIHDGGATLRRARDVAELPHDPSLLWLDLLSWGRAHYGRGWAWSACVLMCAAASLRILARTLREIFLRGDARRTSRSTTRLYAAALRQLFVERQQPAGQSFGRIS